MKIFLDVGAHEGQTLISVLDPKYSFDKIFVFEPVEKLHVKLNKIAAGKNVHLLKYGLWNQDATQKIYSPGTVAGSLFSTHQDVNENNFELCRFVSASEWFKENIRAEDEVYVKLNCEGAEADILLDLLESKEIFKIKNVMIDFDVRKIKGLENSQQHVLDKFEKSHFESYSLCEEIMQGPTAIVRTQGWLDQVGARNSGLRDNTKQVIYWAKMVLTGKRPGYTWELKHLIKKYTPLFLLRLAGARRK